jgi:hypothetical protein
MTTRFFIYAIHSAVEIDVRIDDPLVKVGDVFHQLADISVKAETGESTVVRSEEVVCKIESIWSYGTYFEELGYGMSARLKVNPEFVIQLRKFMLYRTPKTLLVILSNHPESDSAAP